MKKKTNRNIVDSAGTTFSRHQALVTSQWGAQLLNYEAHLRASKRGQITIVGGDSYRTDSDERKRRFLCHHECEVFSGSEHEAAESERNWNGCEKNPGHKQFISAQNFTENYLPRLQSDQKRGMLKNLIDLTVRLRVSCTSLHRPDDDDLAAHRGTGKLRTGTGFIYDVHDPDYNKPNLLNEGLGNETKKHWRFYVQTACHVVYNTEEAKETKVDLFYDENSCERDGRMKSVWGVRVINSTPGIDWCSMLCETCDEDLGKRIESAVRCRFYDDKLKPEDIFDLGLLKLQHYDEKCQPVVIVSHPHGQPKQITVGELKTWQRSSIKHQVLIKKKGCYEYDWVDEGRVEYTTPTCPGSSGASVLVWDRDLGKFSYFLWFSPVHSGGVSKTSSSTQHNQLQKLRGHETTQQQLNYGFNI
ncbi:hypothetical protein ElyMa_005316100 [Elysia marginata]|uniref:Peptidase S1 domain-containing protein n=1 Tax=Elysia marginata TaxID=1093978 RepID=A0AAV4K4Y7_9GAST|nr:hypothetical protein ElyMa_005316100 [Elysia marginata]